MKPGIELIAQERAEQIEKHKRTIDYDVTTNYLGQLIDGARTLMIHEDLDLYDDEQLLTRKPLHWDHRVWLKMCHKSHIERLTIAGAFIAAEIDRLQAHIITLEYFNGTEWVAVSTWTNELAAWSSLGDDNYNYRTVDENGNVIRINK